MSVFVSGCSVSPSFSEPQKRAHPQPRWPGAGRRCGPRGSGGSAGLERRGFGALKVSLSRGAPYSATISGVRGDGLLASSRLLLQTLGICVSFTLAQLCSGHQTKFSLGRRKSGSINRRTFAQLLLNAILKIAKGEKNLPKGLK